MFQAHQANRISERARRLASREALISNSQNIRTVLADLNDVCGEFDANLMPFRQDAVVQSASGDTRMSWDISVHYSVRKIQSRSGLLTLSMDALRALVNAWDEKEYSRLSCFIESFGSGAWFAPYDALLSKSPYVTGLGLCSWIIPGKSDDLMAMAASRLLKSSGALPLDDAPRTAYSFFEEALRSIGDGVTRMLAVCDAIIGAETSLELVAPRKFLGSALVAEESQPEIVLSCGPKYVLDPHGGIVSHGTMTRVEGTLAQLVTSIISDYPGFLQSPEISLARRQEWTAKLADKLQQAEVVRATRRGDVIDSDWRLLLHSPKIRPLLDLSSQAIHVWNHPVRLILLTSPYIDRPKQNRPSGNVLYLDPTTEESFLSIYGTLTQAPEISGAES